MYLVVKTPNPSIERTSACMALQAQNEVKAKPALPERFRSMEGLGVFTTRYMVVILLY